MDTDSSDNDKKEPVSSFLLRRVFQNFKNSTWKMTTEEAGKDFILSNNNHRVNGHIFKFFEHRKKDLEDHLLIEERKKVVLRGVLF